MLLIQHMGNERAPTSSVRCGAAGIDTAFSKRQPRAPANLPPPLGSSSTGTLPATVGVGRTCELPNCITDYGWWLPVRTLSLASRRSPAPCFIGIQPEQGRELVLQCLHQQVGDIIRRSRSASAVTTYRPNAPPSLYDLGTRYAWVPSFRKTSCFSTPSKELVGRPSLPDPVGTSVGRDLEDVQWKSGRLEGKNDSSNTRATAPGASLPPRAVAVPFHWVDLFLGCLRCCRPAHTPSLDGLVCATGPAVLLTQQLRNAATRRRRKRTARTRLIGGTRVFPRNIGGLAVSKFASLKRVLASFQDGTGTTVHTLVQRSLQKRRRTRSERGKRTTRW